MKQSEKNTHLSFPGDAQSGCDCLCETWLKRDVFLPLRPLNKSSPCDSTNAHVARAAKQVGVLPIFNLTSKLDIKFN